MEVVILLIFGYFFGENLLENIAPHPVAENDGDMAGFIRVDGIRPVMDWYADTWLEIPADSDSQLSEKASKAALWCEERGRRHP